MSDYILPAIFIFLFAYAHHKKVNVYNAFTNGGKGAITLAKNILPFVASILIAVALLRESGILDVLSNFVAPAFEFFGIPKELVPLVLLRPFTGSGSLALLSDTLSLYGVDSYIGRCACVILGCSETIFYVTAIYSSHCNLKKLYYAIPVALVASFCGSIIACLLCKIM